MRVGALNAAHGRPGVRGDSQVQGLIGATELPSWGTRMTPGGRQSRARQTPRRGCGVAAGGAGLESRGGIPSGEWAGVVMWQHVKPRDRARSPGLERRRTAAALGGWGGQQRIPDTLLLSPEAHPVLLTFQVSLSFPLSKSEAR